MKALRILGGLCALVVAACATGSGLSPAVAPLRQPRELVHSVLMSIGVLSANEVVAVSLDEDSFDAGNEEEDGAMDRRRMATAARIEKFSRATIIAPAELLPGVPLAPLEVDGDLGIVRRLSSTEPALIAVEVRGKSPDSAIVRVVMTHPRGDFHRESWYCARFEVGTWVIALEREGAIQLSAQ